MKTLLLLNGPDGWQTGIEDGFLYLKEINELSDVYFFYYDDYSKKNGYSVTLSKIINISIDFQPSLIIFFHIGKMPINKEFILTLKAIKSSPKIVYDEGDMFGSIAKPLTKSMRVIIRYSDIISIRGLGPFYDLIYKLNKKIIYTPHHADIARFDSQPHIKTNRDNFITLIGNRIKPRFLSFIRRLPGALQREKFIKYIGNHFPNQKFLYGNGWKDFIGNQGPIDFQKQMEIYKNSWITIAYEHYPEVPFYFSNRLPIALLSGSLYVCHYHKGYEIIFKNCDFIFFFKTNKEAVDILKFLESLGEEELLERAKRAREFALKYYTPQVIWRKFFHNIKINSNE